MVSLEKMRLHADPSVLDLDELEKVFKNFGVELEEDEWASVSVDCSPNNQSLPISLKVGSSTLGITLCIGDLFPTNGEDEATLVIVGTEEKEGEGFLNIVLLGRGEKQKALDERIWNVIGRIEAKTEGVYFFTHKPSNATDEEGFIAPEYFFLEKGDRGYITIWSNEGQVWDFVGIVASERRPRLGEK